MKFKILCISHTSNFFGAEQSFLFFLKHLNQEKFEPVVVLPNNEGLLVDRIKSLGYKFHIIENPSWVSSGEVRQLARDTFDEFVTAKSYIELIQEEKIDLVYTNTITRLAGAIAAKSTGIPHVWHIREVLQDHPLKSSFDQETTFTIVRQLSDKIIANSHAVARQFSTGDNDSNLHVVHNAIDAEAFVCAEHDRLRRELSVGPDCSLVGIIGQIHKHKNHEDLVRAFQSLKSRGLNCKLVVIGEEDTEYKHFLLGLISELQLQDRVCFIGFREDMPEVFNSLDLVVVASLAEPFGRTTIEAMAAGKPVVATNTGASPEIVVDGVTGILVPPGHPEKMADAIYHILNDDRRAKEMGEAGRQRVLLEFTKDKYIAGIEAALTEAFGIRGDDSLTDRERGHVLLQILNSLKAHELVDLIERTLEYDKLQLDERTNWAMAAVKDVEQRDSVILLQQKQLEKVQSELLLKEQHLKNLETRLGDLHRSLSWRITSPLRVMLDMLLGFTPFRKIAARKREATTTTSAITTVASTDFARKTRNNALVKTALSAKTESADYIIFPVIDWHFRVQRPQHLSKQLAQLGHRVFYLTTTFSESSAEPAFEILESPERNVFLVKLSCPLPHPHIYSDIPSPEQRKFLTESLLRLQQFCELRQTVSIVDLPFWRSIAEGLRGNVIVYDCMDHHAGFSTNTELMLQEEERLLHCADLVVTTSQRLSDIVAREVPNTIIRNGAEVSFFSSYAGTPALKGDKPVIGYFGAISEWFDIDLVVAAAKAYPQWSFVLIGSTFGCDTEKAAKVANIQFIDEVPYATLPGYLQAFDVCIIPFKITELTLCTNPVKVYEYLSAGKPVVATAMPEVKLIADHVHVAESAQEFIDLLSVAMQERGNQALAQTRTAWAQGHDWQSRARGLKTAVEALFPKVSVIVLTYNNLHLTKDCLESLCKYTDYPALEIIVVDNASSDDTPAYLQEFATQHPNVRVVLNDANLGFAAGNNVGLRVATGEYLVMLNNDTVVTKGWLFDLIRHLRIDSTLGLVGPVTNSIGNEAQIEISYPDKEQMQILAREYTSSHARQLLFVRNVAFFCVAMSRATWDKIGGLDENFNVGFFEDDDYCRRIHAENLKIAIAEDVFVHHEHSASFNVLRSEEKQRIFERNKQVYEAKWGEWVPHVYRRENSSSASQASHQ